MHALTSARSPSKKLIIDVAVSNDVISPRMKCTPDIGSIGHRSTATIAGFVVDDDVWVVSSCSTLLSALF